MKKLNGELQYKLSNGTWDNCDERTEEFLTKCVKNDYHGYSMEEVISLLNSGKIVASGTAHYERCRIKPVATHAPVVSEFIPDNEEYGY